MRLTELLTAHLERETAISRRVLARVPEGKPDWKPHEKSMPLGYLAHLVATIPGWITMAIQQDSLDLNPTGQSRRPAVEWQTAQDLLRLLEEASAGALRALQGTTDEHLVTGWKLLVGGRVVDESPRHKVIADNLTHGAHHRGQLSVYLRLNNVPLPPMYGPTADERGF